MSSADFLTDDNLYEDCDDVINANSGNVPASSVLNADCNRIRLRINDFVGKNPGTQTKWLGRMGISPTSFSNFMKYKKKFQGDGNGLYHSARSFFFLLEKKQKAKAAEEKAKAKMAKKSTDKPAIKTAKGVPASQKKQATIAVVDDTASPPTAGAKATKPATAKKTAKAAFQELADIVAAQPAIPGQDISMRGKGMVKALEELKRQVMAGKAKYTEAKRKVVYDKQTYELPCPIYEDCDHIRKKMRALLAECAAEDPSGKDVPKAFVMKCIGFPNMQLQGVQWDRFFTVRGALEGAESATYQLCYVFLEKLRRARDEPKDSHRRANEKDKKFSERYAPLGSWEFCPPPTSSFKPNRWALHY